MKIMPFFNYSYEGEYVEVESKDMSYIRKHHLSMTFPSDRHTTCTLPCPVTGKSSPTLLRHSLVVEHSIKSYVEAAERVMCTPATRLIFPDLGKVCHGSQTRRLYRTSSSRYFLDSRPRPNHESHRIASSSPFPGVRPCGRLQLLRLPLLAREDRARTLPYAVGCSVILDLRRV